MNCSAALKSYFFAACGGNLALIYMVEIIYWPNMME
jgi:hypothetical protein